MTSNADRFDAATRRQRVTAEKHPPGMDPGLEYDEHGGTGVVATDELDLKAGELPDEQWLIERFGLDPDVWQIIDGTLQCRQWQRYDGQWLHYLKAQMRRRSPAELELLASLRDRVNKRPAIKQPRRARPDGAYVCVITDTQIGKGEGGGTDAFISRFAESVDAAVARLHHLRDRGGWRLGHIGIFAGGDMLEGISGQYASQPFRIDLGLRDQLEVAAQCMDYAVDRFVDAGADQIDVAFVPSNHGEQRSGKSLATSERDSTDLMIADQLRRAYTKNKRYDRVNVVVPWGDETTLCLDLAGTNVGLAHGHQTGNKQTDVWWKGQIAGGEARPLAAARILVVGHRHHLKIMDVADGRTLIQCPALDGGSAYFTEMTGEDAPPGLVTFVVDNGRPHEIELLRMT